MKKIENNSLSINNLGEDVELYGFVGKKRNLGGLIFIDLRDRSGIVQLVIRPEDSSYELAESLRNEYVIKVIGTVSERESKNDKEYAVASSTVLDDVNYVYLMNINDYSDFLFCAFDEVDGLYEVEDAELLDQLIKIFDKDLNGERKFHFDE